MFYFPVPSTSHSRHKPGAGPTKPSSTSSDTTHSDAAQSSSSKDGSEPKSDEETVRDLLLFIDADAASSESTVFPLCLDVSNIWDMPPARQRSDIIPSAGRLRTNINRETVESAVAPQVFDAVMKVPEPPSPPPEPLVQVEHVEHVEVLEAKENIETSQTPASPSTVPKKTRGRKYRKPKQAAKGKVVDEQKVTQAESDPSKALPEAKVTKSPKGEAKTSKASGSKTSPNPKRTRARAKASKAREQTTAIETEKTGAKEESGSKKAETKKAEVKRAPEVEKIGEPKKEQEPKKPENARKTTDPQASTVASKPAPKRRPRRTGSRRTKGGKVSKGCSLIVLDSYSCPFRRSLRRRRPLNLQALELCGWPSTIKSTCTLNSAYLYESIRLFCVYDLVYKVHIGLIG